MVPAHVMARQVVGEMVILDLNSGVYFGLDTIGARMWELLAQGMTLRQICDGLVDVYDVTLERLEADAVALAGQLLERQLVARA